MKILLVDDEVSIIQMLLPALKSMNGPQVRAAITGEEAIESAEAWGGIDLLITDVFMDPMNGFTLRNKLEQRHPAFRTLFLSGHELSRYTEHIRDAEVLYKPFDWNQMLHAIAAMNVQPAAASGAPQLGTGAIADKVNIVPPDGGILPDAPLFLGEAATGHEVVNARSLDAGNVVPTGDLDGTTLGSYRILRTMGFSLWGTLYHAVQLPMGRAVIMEVLRDEKAAIPGVKQQFLANAAARANVQHPFLLPVYEGGDAQGHFFYTYEDIDGESLAALIASGYRFEDRVVLSILEGVADALSYLESHHISCAELDATHIFLGKDSKPRMANPAVHKGGISDVSGQIRSLAWMVKPLLPGGRASSKSLRTTMICMEGNGDLTLTTWAALLQLLQVLHPTGNSAIALPGPGNLGSPGGVLKPFPYWILLALMVCVAWGVHSYRGLGRSENKTDQMLKVPAGEFIDQTGEKVQLPEFWMDRYQVTVGQYAKFLEHLQAHPEVATNLDSPEQPKGKSHLPRDWAVFYAAAKEGKPYKHLPIDLNTPVFNVDWWDACAYARWKGRRLPNEQEWEKAARGTEGRDDSWGPVRDPKKCNSKADDQDPPNSGAHHEKVDRFMGWRSVVAMPADVSPFGIVGMAGNVSEWTSSLDFEKKCPVIRGGNFATDDHKVTRRIALLAPDGASEYVGFRTVSDTPPTP